MDLKNLFRLLPPSDGGFTFDYQGSTFPLPYETLFLDGREYRGLRENTYRISLLDSILTRHDCPRQSLLDIGCNLGTIPNHFRRSFKDVFGIEKDGRFAELARMFHPGLPVFQADMNQIPLGRYVNRTFNAVFALSMIEYITNKQEFVEGLYKVTENICIVEGHSEDELKGLDLEYEALLKSQPWTVMRREELTDPGLNAPQHSVGRPVWACCK